MPVNRDGHVTDGERLADVGLFARDADGHLDGLLVGRRDDVEAVPIAADGEIALHVSFRHRSNFGFWPPEMP